MDREEMIRILEEIIRDPDTNPTARVTAIRALREIPPPEPISEFEGLHAVELRRMVLCGDRLGLAGKAAAVDEVYCWG